MIRYTSIAGFALLTLYYFVYPPFGVSSLGNTEGHVFIVNKIFVEAAVLFYFIVSKNNGYGIVPDYFMKTMHHDKYWSAHPIENRGNT